MSNETKPVTVTNRVVFLQQVKAHFDSVCANNEYTGAKRKTCSFHFCAALYELDIIFSICLIGERDLSDEIEKLLPLLQEREVNHVWLLQLTFTHLPKGS